MSFQQGVSGLNAAAKSLDVISNNVSNQGTVGFKASSSRFADIYASQSGSVGMQIGIGATIGSVTQSFNQGTVTVTNNPLDVAINGNGFFRLDKNGEIIYSRNGQFDIDKDGYIVNGSGAKLTGYLTNSSGEPDRSAPQPLKINSSTLPPLATGAASAASSTLAGLTLAVNVDSRAKIPGSVWNPSVTTAISPYTTSVLANSSALPSATELSKADAGVAAMYKSLKEATPAMSDSDIQKRIVGKAMSIMNSVVDGLQQQDNNGQPVPLTATQKTNMLNAFYTAITAAVPTAITSTGGTYTSTLIQGIVGDASINGAQYDDAGTTFSAGTGTAKTASYIVSAGDTISLQNGLVNAFAVNGQSVPKIDTYNYTTSVDIYDSEGVAHKLTYFFQKDENSGPVDAMTNKPTGVPGLWHVYAQVDQTNGANVQLDDGLMPGQPLDLMFDGSGNLQYMGHWNATGADATGNPIVDANGNPVGARMEKGPLSTTANLPASKITAGTNTVLTNVSVDLVGVQADLKAVGTTTTAKVTSPLTFKADLSGITQYGSTSSTSKITQDGYASGELAGLSVTKDGMVQGRYSNGQTLNLGQMLIATFRNNNGLMALGGNAWAQTLESGIPAVNPPGTGVAGTVVSGSVENSNVDLTQAMVDMIAQQRAYQANSQSIKTQDQILQTLVNLK